MVGMRIRACYMSRRAVYTHKNPEEGSVRDMLTVLGNLVAFSIVVLIVVISIRSIVKSHKSGSCAGCSGSCASCAGCHRAAEANLEKQKHTSM